MTAIRWIQAFLRFGMGTVFLFAAMSKAIEKPTNLEQPTIYSEWSQARGSKFVLIEGEVAIALWLFSGVAPCAASVVSLVILSSFTGLIAYEVGRDHPKPCGCLGNAFIAKDIGTTRASLSADLMRNVLMMSGAIAQLVYLDNRSPSKP